LEAGADARSIGLLDGLAAFIRFRLSSRARWGAVAGPETMRAGVVLAGSILARSDFAVVHPYPVAGGVARSGRDGVAVV